MEVRRRIFEGLRLVCESEEKFLFYDSSFLDFLKAVAFCVLISYVIGRYLPSLVMGRF